MPENSQFNFDAPLEPPPPPPPPPRRRMHPKEVAFWAYFHANPVVLLEIVKLARLAQARGRQHWGIMAVMNVVRWNLDIHAKDPHAPWKISNNHTPYYSRYIMAKYPDLAGYFTTKRAAADDMQLEEPEGGTSDND